MNASTTPTTLPLDLDLQVATLVRPGTARDLDRLQYLGGRILHRGEHHDGDGATHPAVLVRIGRQRVLVVLSSDATARAPTTPATHGQRDPPRRAA